jgi:hypothetical protein
MRAGMVAVAALLLFACSAFAPEVGALKDTSGCEEDESGEYGGDAAAAAGAGDDAGPEEGGGCGHDS